MAAMTSGENWQLMCQRRNDRFICITQSHYSVSSNNTYNWTISLINNTNLCGGKRRIEPMTFRTLVEGSTTE